MRVLPGTNETLWFSILDGAGEQGNDGGEETQANDRDRHAAEDGKVSTQLEQEQDVDQRNTIRNESSFPRFVPMNNIAGMSDIIATAESSAIAALIGNMTKDIANISQL